MIKYREGHEIDYIRLIELLYEVGQNDMPTDYKHLASIVESSRLVVTAWDFDYMVGFAHLTGDEAPTDTISNVMVDYEYKDKGIEKELRTRINTFLSSKFQTQMSKHR